MCARRTERPLRCPRHATGLDPTSGDEPLGDIRGGQLRNIKFRFIFLTRSPLPGADRHGAAPGREDHAFAAAVPARHLPAPRGSRHCGTHSNRSPRLHDGAPGARYPRRGPECAGDPGVRADSDRRCAATCRAVDSHRLAGRAPDAGGDGIAGGARGGVPAAPVVNARDRQGLTLDSCAICSGWSRSEIWVGPRSSGLCSKDLSRQRS